MNILDTKISLYADSTYGVVKDATGTPSREVPWNPRPGVVVPIRNFLFSHTGGANAMKHIRAIQQMREELSPLMVRCADCRDEEERKGVLAAMSAIKKRYKPWLPVAVIGGVFDPLHRTIEHLVQPSGLLCLDFDGKENRHVLSWEIEKQYLSARCANLAYIGLSVSGDGLFAVVPIVLQTPEPMPEDTTGILWRRNYAEQYEKLYLSLQEVFKEKYNLKADDACKDITRLRYLSYDPTPAVNPDAIPFYVTLPPKPDYSRMFVASAPKKSTERRERSAWSDEERARWYVDQLTSRRLDITQDEPDWYRTALALAELGERGRELFHRVSSMHPRYNPRETDRKFDLALRDSSRSVHLSTFSMYCRKALGLPS